MNENKVGSSLTEDGLDDESGGVTRSRLLLEEELEAVESVLDELVVRGGVRKSKLMPVGVGGSENSGLSGMAKSQFQEEEGREK